MDTSKSLSFLCSVVIVSTLSWASFQIELVRPCSFPAFIGSIGCEEAPHARELRSLQKRCLFAKLGGGVWRKRRTKTSDHGGALQFKSRTLSLPDLPVGSRLEHRPTRAGIGFLRLVRRECHVPALYRSVILELLHAGPSAGHADGGRVDSAGEVEPPTALAGNATAPHESTQARRPDRAERNQLERAASTACTKPLAASLPSNAITSRSQTSGSTSYSSSSVSQISPTVRGSATSVQILAPTSSSP